jgi:hypothetical protein
MGYTVLDAAGHTFYLW